jgi:putative NIF3 family GTP cyclohydrolase 1 type 2
MSITAQAVVGRIQQKLGSGWKDSPSDAFLAGKPESEVKGIVTTYSPSIEILEKVVASGKNMIISRESPFYTRGRQTRGTGGSFFDEGGIPAGGGPAWRTGPAPSGFQGQNQESIKTDPVYKKKEEYIAANNLIVYRLFDNWNARVPNGQVQGLAKALGWEKSYKQGSGAPWSMLNGTFAVPSGTLKETATAVKKKLGLTSIRVAGKPDAQVSRAALVPGMAWLWDMQKLCAEPEVDLFVIGEPMWENENGQYFFDQFDTGLKKGGLLVLGQEGSENPGSGEMAAWLKTFVSEVPVEWVPSTDPAWMPY